MKLKNANVLITGGASGIGKLMGRMALEKGAKRFIIWDINIIGIEAAKKELSKYGKVEGYVVDVANYDIVEKVYNENTILFQTIISFFRKPFRQATGGFAALCLERGKCFKKRGLRQFLP